MGGSWLGAEEGGGGGGGGTWEGMAGPRRERWRRFYMKNHQGKGQDEKHPYNKSILSAHFGIDVILRPLTEIGFTRHNANMVCHNTLAFYISH